MSASRPVPRIGRVLDLAGLLLFSVGGALYARAWVGFRSVPDFERVEGGPVFAATEFADGFRRMQAAGTALLSTLFALIYIPIMVSIFL